MKKGAGTSVRASSMKKRVTYKPPSMTTDILLSLSPCTLCSTHCLILVLFFCIHFFHAWHCFYICFSSRDKTEASTHRKVCPLVLFGVRCLLASAFCLFCDTSACLYTCMCVSLICLSSYPADRECPLHASIQTIGHSRRVGQRRLLPPHLAYHTGAFLFLM